MPLVRVSNDVAMHYVIDDFTDPWKNAPAIVLQVFNTQDAIAEDETGAWLAQEMFPAFARSSACVRARALVATVGTHKHAWLLEFTSNAAREQTPPTAAGLKAALLQAPRSPMTGERIWPPLPA